MNDFDARGCPVSGATPTALKAYEHALAALLAWRSDAEAALARALQEASGFVMAHVLQAYGRVCSRDPRRVRSARPVLARAARLPSNARERLHLAAIAAVLDDDYEGAKSRLGELLRVEPRDVLALHVAHSFDYITGDVERMRERVAAVLPAWSTDLPGYHAVLAMNAFALVECGACEAAERAARAALALNPADARAHHVMAHVFETMSRAAEGARWLCEHHACWGRDSVVATHCWWHLALFQLERGRPDHALAIYDQQLRAAHSDEIADLIDATALLWRVQLGGNDDAARWKELASAWSAHIDDAFCSFNDLHAMLAFVGARDWVSARRLERALTVGRSMPTRHARTTRQLGLPICRALIAFGRAQYERAVGLLARLPALAHRLGGSHAQRDVLHLTLLQAIERVRRPTRRSSVGASEFFDSGARPLPAAAPQSFAPTVHGVWVEQRGRSIESPTLDVADA
jgi:tetratricopeptide (TPR) repeat protein